MVEAVNNQRQSSGGTIIPQVLGTVAGIGIGGYALRGEIGVKQALHDDKFELSKDTVKGLNKEQKEAYETILEERTTASDKAILEQADKDAGKILGKKDSISVKKYLSANSLGSEDNINKMIESNQAEIEKFEAQLEGKTKGAAKKITDKITSHKTVIEGYQRHLDIIGLADEKGHISREALTGKLAAEVKTTQTTVVTDALKTLKGKLPKIKFSFIKGAIGAVSGLIAGVIVAKIISPKTAPQE